MSTDNLLFFVLLSSLLKWYFPLCYPKSRRYHIMHKRLTYLLQIPLPSLYCLLCLPLRWFLIPGIITSFAPYIIGGGTNRLNLSHPPPPCLTSYPSLLSLITVILRFYFFNQWHNQLHSYCGFALRVVNWQICRYLHIDGSWPELPICTLDKILLYTFTTILPSCLVIDLTLTNIIAKYDQNLNCTKKWIGSLILTKVFKLLFWK